MVHYDSGNAAPGSVNGWPFPIGDIPLAHTEVMLDTIETLERLRPDDRMSTFRGLSEVGRQGAWMRKSVKSETLATLFGQWGNTLNSSNPARQYVTQMAFFVAVGTVEGFLPSLGHSFEVDIKAITAYDAATIERWSTEAWSLMKTCHRVVYDVLQPMARMLVRSFTDDAQRGATAVFAAVVLPYLLSCTSCMIEDLDTMSVSTER